MQKRTNKNTNWDNLSLEFHQKIREGYLGLKEHFPNRIHIINADRDEKEIFEEVWKIIEKKLRKDDEDWDLGKRQCGVNEEEDCDSCQ